MDFDTTYKGYEGLQMSVGDIQYLSDVYFNITELGGYKEYYVSDVRYHEDYVTWIGKSYDDYKNGHLILVQKGALFGGLIMENNETWQLFPNSDSMMLALKRDIGHDKYYTCATDEEYTPLDEPEAPDPCQVETNNCYALIRTALEMTPEAHEWLETFIGPFNSVFEINIGKLIFYLTLEAQINIAFDNSGVKNKVFQIAIVDDMSFPHNYEFSWFHGYWINNIAKDIDDLQIYSPFTSDLVSYQCDLGVMMTDADYPDFAGIVNGIGPEGSDEVGFCAIVEIKYALGALPVFAHEIGHLFGGRHQKPFDDTDICNHGWAVPVTGSFEKNLTIVTSPDITIENVILNYSNPFVKIDGHRTGTGQDFNAAAIDNNGCYISNYRPDPYWNIRITGDDTICQEVKGSLIYSAEVHEAGSSYLGHPPYKYIWQYGYEWNISNFPDLNWATEPNDGSYVVIPYDPAGANKELFIRLIVVSDDDEILLVVKHVKLFPEGCDGPLPPSGYFWEPRSIAEPSAIQVNCDLSPRLRQYGNDFQFDSRGEDFGQVIFQFSDITGRILKRDVFKSSDFARIVSTTYLPSGFYFLNISSDCGSMTKKIFIK